MTRFDDFLNEHVKKEFEEKNYRTADGKLHRKVKLKMKVARYYDWKSDFKQFYEENRWRSFDDVELWKWLSCIFPENVLWAKKSSFNEMTPDEAAELITKFRKKVLEGEFPTSTPDAGRVLKKVVSCYLPGKPVEEFPYNKTMPEFGVMEEMNAVEVIFPLRALERLGEVCTAVSVYDRVMKLCDELKKGGFKFDKNYRRKFEVRVRLMDEDEELHGYVVEPNGLIDCTHLVNALCGDPCLYISDNKKGWCDALRDEYVKGTVGAELKGTKIDSGVLTVGWEDNRKVPLKLKKILGREEFKKKESEMLKENKED